MISEGGARVPTSDQQREGVCVDDQTKQHTAKAAPCVDKECGERLREKGYESGRSGKGARTAIGKTRADGQKCSRVSLLLGRAGHIFKQQNKRLVKLDMAIFCCVLDKRTMAVVKGEEGSKEYPTLRVLKDTRR
jgi:hypothetical protein